MAEDRKQVEDQPAREEESGAAAADRPGRDEQESAAGSPDALETRLPLKPGEGPSSPQGDALLDGSGSRHGVDSREERPGAR